MDSQAPNKAFYEWAINGSFIGKPDIIKPEYKWGNSRFDFYIETKNRKIFIEVKSFLKGKSLVPFVKSCLFVSGQK